MSDERTESILQRLAELRADDAPTHGGRVLSYVYDSGLAELDELARAAAASVQAVNGLDPTAFPSVARMEADVITFACELVHASAHDRDVTGLVTSGGTESCLLAVKSARDRWRAAGGTGVPRIVAPVTVHAAFHKAAHYFGLDLELVPVDEQGVVDTAELTARLTTQTALVVVSAPCYPFAALDPVAEIAGAAADRGVACHVDACIGGWVLPFWSDGGEGLSPWDFRVPGVTSVSLDAHKYGFAPKGASVLLFGDPDAKRAASFATTRWPGYPVVNPTMLGSRSAMSLAATWAIVAYLGPDGFAALTARSRSATHTLQECISGIVGLRVVGDPIGPLFAVAADHTVADGDQVDPHIWADRVRELGWVLQPQPGLHQADGPDLPRTTHLTVTPVTGDEVDGLTAALIAAADDVRGVPGVDLGELLSAMPELAVDAGADSATAGGILRDLGLAGEDAGGALPDQLAPVMALLDVMPARRSEALLTELLARCNERHRHGDH
ncbi:pyridoxal phosphate-dependent decarboxylase family protein [Gordonia sp. SL306]|uniref:pyridoxal phosphate-dependent decarboxylase family protein n=1 Tax=Gordonia sp. SL306 TaxID=2995145 RepID=UPI00227132B7|nr:aspartate aminotransferase family protein [Gordonia sp. SL306]WAC57691.1 aspartate aminotransferase family protein [Gordonia sp. SL306]